MASNDQPTKEQSSQTHDSLEKQAACPESQGRVQPDSDDFSPLASPPDSDVVSTGPDQTVPKEKVDGKGESNNDDPPNSNQGQGQNVDQGQTEEQAEDTSRRYVDHQCSHDGSVVDEEHVLHQPKQEVQGRKLMSDGSFEEDYLHWASRYTGDRPHSGADSALSSSLSSASSLTLCDKCSATDRLLTCCSSKDFWKGIERSKCCERVWSHFNERLKTMFPQEPALEQARVMKLLKALLGVNGPLDIVSIANYLRLVRFFGPFRSSEDNRCVIVKQLEDLVAHSNLRDLKNKKNKLCWFAGPMTRDKANEKLEGKPTGTFLIRMSETEEEDGNFVLSLMMADITVEHFRLQGHPDDAIRSDPFNLNLEFRGKRFSSLPELVNSYLRMEEICDEDCDNATRCTRVCPDLPFTQIINGYK